MRLSKSLEEQVAARNVHILLALIRNINVSDSSGRDQTDGLLATIQRTNVEVERDITNQQETTTAAKKAQLDQEQKLIEVARQTVAADTHVKTATLNAEGEKKAAEIGAQRDLTVADIEKQIADLDAQRTRQSWPGDRAGAANEKRSGGERRKDARRRIRQCAKLQPVHVCQEF